MRYSILVVGLALGGCPGDTVCDDGEVLKDGECVVDVDTDVDEPEPEPEPDTDVDDPDTDVDDPDTDVVDTDLPGPPDCGANAHPVGPECECNDTFDWCTDNPLEVDCCPIGDGPADSAEDSDPLTGDTDLGADTDWWDTDSPPLTTDTRYEVTVVGGTINGDSDGTGTTWDTNIIGDGHPDAWIIASGGGAEFWESGEEEDTLSPAWDESFEVTMYPGFAFQLTVWDNDVFPNPDDEIEAFVISSGMLAANAGGTLTLTQPLMTLELAIAVIPPVP